MASESLAYSNGGLALRASFVVPSWINFPSISLNRDRNSDVVLGKSDEPTRIDYGVRDRPVAGNNQVVDKTDPLVLAIENRLADDLTLGAPTKRNVTQFIIPHAQECGSGHLRVRHGRSREDDAAKHQVSTKPHESIPLDVASPLRDVTG